MDIYLDVDGVLLTKNLEPANYVNEFLRYVLSEYPNSTYWLTTRCNGDASVVARQIAHLFEPDVAELLNKIKPTTRILSPKTSSINFSRPFIWFDDNLFNVEKEELIKRDSFDNWIGVDLKKDPDMLSKFIESFPMPIDCLSD